MENKKIQIIKGWLYNKDLIFLQSHHIHNSFVHKPSITNYGWLKLFANPFSILSLWIITNKVKQNPKKMSTLYAVVTGCWCQVYWKKNKQMKRIQPTHSDNKGILSKVKGNLNWMIHLMPSQFTFTVVISSQLFLELLARLICTDRRWSLIPPWYSFSNFWKTYMSQNKLAMIASSIQWQVDHDQLC